MIIRAENSKSICLRALMLCGTVLASFVIAPSVVAAQVCNSDPAIVSANMPSADLDGRFGPVPDPGKRVKVAYVTQLIDDAFWVEVMHGLRSEAARLDLVFDATAPKDRSSESEQLAVAEAALAGNPDILILTAINATNLKSVIDKANARGIPTLSINLRSEGVRVHIGTNHVALGASAAEFLHEHLPGGAAVAQIEGEKTSPYRIDRVQGFAEGLANYPNLKLVGSLQADWDGQKAQEATLKLISANPEIKGIYANSDVMAVGAVKALEEAGRLKDVVVVGTDGVIIAKESIAAGKLKGTAAQFPVKEGILGIQVGLRLLGCQAVPGWVVSPQAVMTEKSVGDYTVTQ